MPANFADRLMDAIREKNSRVCVGIDPVPESFPRHLQPDDGKWTNHGDVDQKVYDATREFCWHIIEAVAGTAVAVKFNSAFFERLSSDGIGLLDTVLSDVEESRLGLLTILDAKRGDIGSTADAYARAVFREYYGGFPDVPDAVTINPYLGTDGIQPFLEEARRLGRGVFVLVRTSNPSAAEIQDLMTEDGKRVYRHVADLVSAWGEPHIGSSGYSLVGAVVGATWPEQLAELRQAMPHTPFLVPGYGAQGGAAADVAGAFDADGLGAIVNSSRGIMYASDGEDFARVAAGAAVRMRDDINRALGA